MHINLNLISSSLLVNLLKLLDQESSVLLFSIILRHKLTKQMSKTTEINLMAQSILYPAKYLWNQGYYILVAEVFILSILLD